MVWCNVVPESSTLGQAYSEDDAPMFHRPWPQGAGESSQCHLSLSLFAYDVPITRVHVLHVSEAHVCSNI